jgi:ribA/ribD-fused uncharacterized protein
MKDFLDEIIEERTLKNKEFKKIMEKASNTIYFYATGDEYGYMSNFARYPINIDGKKYKTTEHYFQSQKFAGTKYEAQIMNAGGPKDAANMGRDRSFPLRSDWESVKYNVMEKAVFAKFRQHKDIQEKLLATGDLKIVENTTSDLVWGCGTNGSGKNLLGKILENVRSELRAEAAARVSVK